MGMFDRVTVNFPLLGEHLQGRTFQTKDLDCCMVDYWISPSGELFEKNMSGTADMVEDSEAFLGARWEPNGNHGRILPVYHSGGVRIYEYEEDIKAFREVHLFFKQGRVIDFIEDVRSI